MKYSKSFEITFSKLEYGAAAKFFEQPFSDNGASRNKEMKTSLMKRFFFFGAPNFPFIKLKCGRIIVVKSR